MAIECDEQRQLPLENSNNTAPVEWLTSQPANQSVHTKQPSVIRWVSFAHRFCCSVHSRLVPNRLHSSDCQSVGINRNGNLVIHQSSSSHNATNSNDELQNYADFHNSPRTVQLSRISEREMC